MYTKIFKAMYDGTLADNWQALITFQQLLILANEDGVVDMTIGAIHRATGIPADILAAGIQVLEAPDKASRTPDMEGRRIVRLEKHRDWGWFLVNFKKYRQMITREEKKEADRIRIQAQREAEKSVKNSNNNDVADCSEVSQGVSGSSDVSQSVADVAHTDTDLEEKKKSSRPADAGTCDRFAEFWSIYPRPDARKPALQLWQRRKLDRVADSIIADVRRRVAAGDWTERRYTPLPTTYLNQERWADAQSGGAVVHDPADDIFAGCLS